MEVFFIIQKSSLKAVPLASSAARDQLISVLLSHTYTYIPTESTGMWMHHMLRSPDLPQRDTESLLQKGVMGSCQERAPERSLVEWDGHLNEEEKQRGQLCPHPS